MIDWMHFRCVTLHVITNLQHSFQRWSQMRILKCPGHYDITLSDISVKFEERSYVLSLKVWNSHSRIQKKNLFKTSHRTGFLMRRAIYGEFCPEYGEGLNHSQEPTSKVHVTNRIYIELANIKSFENSSSN